MAAKIEWTAADYAAKNAMAKIIDASALAYRVIAERMGGVVSHVRIGYIHNGEKSPVRLSEFLLICEVCNADPVQTLRGKTHGTRTTNRINKETRRRALC